MNITHGSLFSGIGGFDLAADWCGIDNLFQVEIDEFCNKILEKNFPETKRFRDIKDFNADNYEGKLDIISGGFPCQPFSHAGRKRGKEDDRYLWDEMFRVIQQSKPEWVIAENVYGLISMQGGMVLEKVLSDLESEGFEVQTFIIPACSKNAPHRRDRAWIIANSEGNRNRREQERKRSKGDERDKSGRQRMGDKFNNSSQALAPASWERDWLEVASELCGTDDGLSKRVDRIKSLGNAIVPQVAYEFFTSILEVMSKRDPELKITELESLEYSYNDNI